MLAEGVILSVLCVPLSVCLSVSTLTAKPFDLRPWYFAWRLALTPARMGMKAKVIGQRSNIKIVFFSVLSEKKVRGQGDQGQGQKSSLKVTYQGH